MFTSVRRFIAKLPFRRRVAALERRTQAMYALLMFQEAAVHRLSDRVEALEKQNAELQRDRRVGWNRRVALVERSMRDFGLER